MFKALGVLGLLSLAAYADDWNKTFQVNGRPELRVDTGDGSVTIRSWERKEIEARVTTIGWRISPSEVRIMEHQTGDRVELEVRLPNVRWSIGHRSVRIELRVPHELRSDIRTGDGAITVEGVKGDARLSTGDGHIEADGIEGVMEASSGDGRIRLRGRFDTLNIRTGDGSIEADILAGSKMVSGWNVHTDDGHVTLRMPSDFSADLDAHTGDGHITSDLPITMSGSLRRSELRGRLNNGGQPLTIRTNDGSIRIEKL